MLGTYSPKECKNHFQGITAVTCISKDILIVLVRSVISGNLASVPCPYSVERCPDPKAMYVRNVEFVESEFTTYLEEATESARSAKEELTRNLTVAEDAIQTFEETLDDKAKQIILLEGNLTTARSDLQRVEASLAASEKRAETAVANQTLGFSLGGVGIAAAIFAGAFALWRSKPKEREIDTSGDVKAPTV